MTGVTHATNPGWQINERVDLATGWSHPPAPADLCARQRPLSGAKIGSGEGRGSEGIVVDNAPTTDEILNPSRGIESPSCRSDGSVKFDVANCGTNALNVSQNETTI